MNIFKSLFGIQRKIIFEPLQQAGDVQYEIRYQKKKIENNGHKIIYMGTSKYDETVIVYRLILNDGRDNEIIFLRSRVISSKGVLRPDSNMYLIYNPNDKSMRINDIKIEGEHANRGYGSIFMKGLFKIVDEMGCQVEEVTGLISPVDADHFDRLVHIYLKHGFDCILPQNGQGYGKIHWVKPKNRESN